MDATSVVRVGLGPIATNNWELLGDGRRPLRVRRVAVPLLVVFCCVGCGSVTRPSAFESTATASSDVTAASGSDPPLSVGTTTASPTSAESTVAPDTSWLEPFGTESPMRSLPVGWQVMDVGAVRFGVPADWQVPMSGSCLMGTAAGVVLLPFLVDGATCSPAPVLPENQLTVTRADGSDPASAPDAKVGDLDAWRMSGTPIPTFRVAGGIQVGATGPDASQVLATFTASGAHRALQAGPLVATTGWQTVTFDGVSMLVPPDWSPYDLANQDAKHGVMPDPGTCSYGWFATGTPRVLLGSSDIVVGCAATMSWPTQPLDGAWIRDRAGADLTPIATSGQLGDLDVSVVQPDMPGDTTISPIIDVIVHSDSADVRISIGVGTDPSIARTILHSIHSADQTSITPQSTISTTTSTTPPTVSSTSNDTVDASTATTTA